VPELEEKQGMKPVEKGEVSPNQLEEIKQGEFVTIRDVAEKLNYTTSWITYMVQAGRIKAVKPFGGRWRIPKSEFEKIKAEGIPAQAEGEESGEVKEEPEEKLKPQVLTIDVNQKILPKPGKASPKEEKEKASGLFPWLFR